MNKKNKNILYILLIIIFIFFSIYIFVKPNFPNIQEKPIYSDSTQVNSSLTFPNPKLTPGDIIQSATKDEICQSGYSKTVRNVTIEVKQLVYSEYGLSYPQPSGAYEVDHFISLELGGSNDIKNLWPESANPKPGFHEKDAVENYLHERLCSGKETLLEVQNEIKTNWLSIYNSIKA